jgi:hypothetical protein
MIFLIEVLFFIIRIAFLSLGAILSFILGSGVYSLVNSFLYANTIPCIETISLLAALIAPVAFFYGIHHKKHFFQRGNHYNLIIFILSYLFGTILVLLPPKYLNWVPQAYCIPQLGLISKISQSIATGWITSFLAYLSLDFGVMYAKFIEPKLYRKRINRTKKR